MLGRNMIIKSDTYPSKQDEWEGVRVSGCPNFRKLEGLLIYGVGQPTQYGIRTALNQIRQSRGVADQSSRKSNQAPLSVLWINVREEPTIYINGRPFILRYLENPFRNLDEYSGIDAERICRMEERLKDEILTDAQKENMNVLLYDETPSHKPVPVWEAVSPETIHTSTEIYEQLHKEGYHILHKRVPITPEQAPEPRDFDTIAELIESHPGTPTVFNCQMGKGRSTVAMVIGYLVNWYSGMRPTDIHDIDPLSLPLAKVQRVHSKSEQHIVPGVALPTPKSRSDDRQVSLMPEVKDEYQFRIIQHLIRILPDGKKRKIDVDTAIEACNQILDIRKAIVHIRRKAVESRDPEHSKVLFKRCGHFLERYFLMICFASFLHEKNTTSNTEGEDWTFAGYLKRRAELTHLMEKCHDQVKESIEIEKPETPDEFELHIYHRRNGAAVGAGSIIKSDYYPIVSKSPYENDAPNFRKVKDYPVYGTAQPNEKGIQSIITDILSRHPSILWINLREEPLVYIKGHPYVLRDIGHPFDNVNAYRGMECDRIEGLEMRMKEDLLKEAARHGGKILVHDEVTRNSVEPKWVEVSENDIKTCREVYESIAVAGKRGEYHRVPMTPEQCPSTKTFDSLTQLLRNGSFHRQIVFNCQMGWGRSTVASIIACTILKQDGFKDKPDFSRRKMKSFEEFFMSRSGGQLAHPKDLHEALSDSGSDEIDRAEVAPESEERDDPKWTGEFRAILKVLPLLDDGPLRRREVDTAIDQCGEVVNVRNSIMYYKEKAEASRSTDEQQSYLIRCRVYLERYFWILCYSAYYSKQCLEDDTACAGTFAQWIKARPELQTVLKEVQESIHTKSTKVSTEKPDEVDQMVHSRAGAVLGQYAILKSDHFPGCDNRRFELRIDGAPNYRQVPHCRVYGVAVPTWQGLLGVMNQIMLPSNVDEHGATSKGVIWINLREEPVLYLSGKPFVLRDVQRPYNNVEYTGIDSQRVEDMETRMKADLFEEMKTFGDRVLVHDEDSTGKVVSWRENLTQDDCVTFREVFHELTKKHNYDIDYHRIPITDEQAPLPHDFDLITSILVKAPASTHVVFNCQMGRGRTTTGMICACLLHLRIHGKMFHSHIDEMSLEFGTTDIHEMAHQYIRGEYKSILSLLRIMNEAKQRKEEVDKVINCCAGLQNLREAIYQLAIQAGPTPTHGRNNKIHRRGVDYLRRYFYLIVFNAYLHDVNISMENPMPTMKFTEWMSKHPEIVSIERTIDLPKLE